MLDICFSGYLGNTVVGAIAIVKFWCSIAVLMLEGKHDLGVGGIDRVLIVSNFIVNFPLCPCQILF